MKGKVKEGWVMAKAGTGLACTRDRYFIREQPCRADSTGERYTPLAATISEPEAPSTPEPNRPSIELC